MVRRCPRPSDAAILDGYRLAYTSEAPVNWAPGLGTVLSNEEVTNDGPLRAGQLPGLPAQPAPVDDADHGVCRPAGRRPRPVDWPEKVKLMQRNWIGR